MRVLILGGGGMLGHKIFQILSPRFDVFTTFRESNGIWSKYPPYISADKRRLISGVDALHFHSVIQVFSSVKPDVVINCIGIIKQREEAKDPYLSIAINALFPHQLANLCKAMGLRLFHISTDCVFSGHKGHYTESDNPDPVDLYGRTKLLGEIDGPNCLTIRTSFIGRDFVRSQSLVEWFLTQQGSRIQGYTKVIYSGLTTRVLARIIGDLIEKHSQLSGLYHIASEPISKYDLLVKLCDALCLNIEIEPYAELVCDRSLDATRFITATGWKPPSWNEMIKDFVSDETPYDGWKRSVGSV